MPISEIISFLLFIVIVAAVYIVEISLIGFFALNKLRRRPAKNVLRTGPALVIHFLAIAGIICFLYGYLIEPYWLEITTIPIKTARLKQTTFRLVHISDLHCERKSRNEKKLVALINDLKPDIIVFTGDAVNNSAAVPLFKKTMSSLNAGIAKLAVLGNFEIGHRRKPHLYDDIGFEVLNGKTVTLYKNGEALQLSGLGPDNTAGLKTLLEPLTDEYFSVFLYHYSDFVEDLRGLNVDLYLCGHTHGGQVALPFYGALITLSKFGKKYESGFYTVGETILYVNRGIGLESLPAPKVRFFARPEITVFEIEPEK